jgi:hypothetical protein
MVAFKMSPRFHAPGGGQLAAGQSSNTVNGTTKFYNKHASGNAMAGILGQENAPQQQEQQQQQALPQFGGVLQQQQSYYSQEAEYPMPGSSASCDSCGTVVQRYYHCRDCPEDTGLFDLCAACCAACYVQGSIPKPDHPTHDYNTHQMEQVAPLA